MSFNLYAQPAPMVAATMPGTFIVYKEVSGALRWLAVSSNRYQDRDREIVSEQALIDDVARTDRDGQYGPLRWWHVGDPDPLAQKNAWGPGLDLGMCDWADMHDGFLIESGTFHNEEVGAALALKADDLQLSLGFFHPAGEPDDCGVFTHIRRFERSLAPKGNVSNLLTGFFVPTTKEPAMNDAKLKALADRLPGVSEKTIAALIGGHTETATKAAAAEGLRYKADDAQPVYRIDNQLYVLAGDTLIAVKAPPPADDAEAEVVEDEAEDDTEEATKPPLPGAEDAAMDPEADAMPAEAEEEFAGDLSVSAFRQLLTEALAEAISPLLGQLKMADKEEMKGFMGGTAKKDDSRAQEIATLKAQVATLSKKLASLNGDMPKALKAASEASAPVDVPPAESFTVKSPTNNAPVYRTGFDAIAAWAEHGDDALPAG